MSKNHGDMCVPGIFNPNPTGFPHYRCGDCAKATCTEKSLLFRFLRNFIPIYALSAPRRFFHLCPFLSPAKSSVFLRKCRVLLWFLRFFCFDISYFLEFAFRLAAVRPLFFVSPSATLAASRRILCASSPKIRSSFPFLCRPVSAIG